MIAPWSKAFQSALEGQNSQEVPVGAAIVYNGKVLCASGNRVVRDLDPTAHAEMIVLKEACGILGTSRLDRCDLYVTLEPCAMCAGAISLSRIRRLYFSAYDPKGGAVDHGGLLFQKTTCHHRPEVYGGFFEEQSQQMLQDFFKGLRQENS